MVGFHEEVTVLVNLYSLSYGCIFICMLCISKILLLKRKLFDDLKSNHQK